MDNRTRKEPEYLVPCVLCASHSAGTTRITLFGYTPGGLLTLLTSMNPDTGTQITRWDYGVTIGQGTALDSNSLLRGKIEPDGNGQGVTYVYNRQGQPTTMIDSNGTMHAYTHDKLGALLADTVTAFGTGVDSAVVRLERAYNERRLPVRATSLDGAGAVVNEVAWIHNDFNQAVKERQAHGGAAGTGSPEVQYNYAGGSANTIRPTGLTYPDGTAVTISYTTAMADALSRPDHLNLGTTTVAEWAYLGLGTMVRRAYPAAAGATFTLGAAPAGYPGMDRFGRLARTLWQKGADTLVDTQYGRNRSGAVTWRRDALAHSLSVTNQDNFYWYDGLHQVTRHDRGNLVPSGGPPFTGVDPATRAQHETFAFDQTGNWHAYTAQSPALGQWRAHDQANEITSITGPSGVVQPTYDPVGNMTTLPAPDDWDTAMVATWDAWNRLVSTGVGATVTTYAYDALSRRIQTVSAGVTRDTYFNNQWRAIEERLGGMVSTRYVWNPMDRWDMILRERPAASETLYVLKDYLDPVAIIDTSGAVVERYGYDAFGPVRFMEADYTPLSSSACDWTFLFHAEFIDTDSGLYNYGYRYYHPQLGRWLSSDPIGIKGGVNLYEFVGNNGIDQFDSLGQIQLNRPPMANFPQVVVPPNMPGAIGFVEWRCVLIRELDWYTLGRENGVPKFRPGEGPDEPNYQLDCDPCAKQEIFLREYRTFALNALDAFNNVSPLYDKEIQDYVLLGMKTGCMSLPGLAIWHCEKVNPQIA